MNIMISADYAASQSGNFIASIIALGRRIREKGNQVVYVFPEERGWVDWIREENFKVVIIGQEKLKPEQQAATLKSLIQVYDINLLHVHFGMFHYALIHNRNDIKNVKVIVHDHMDFNVQKSITKQRIRSFGYSIIYALNHIQVISVMERKNRSYLFLKHKWFVPNGLSMERYVKESMNRATCRKILGVQENEIVCLLLGWDLKRKGLDIALKAVNECRKKNPRIVLGIIGAGKGKPSECAKTFIIENTNLDPDASWIRYFNDYEDMFAVHRAVDVFVSASRREAFSYGLLEAISQGTPVVVSKVPGTSWSGLYQKSFFYPVEDYHACARAIMKAIKIGRVTSNQQEVLEKYSIDHWCDQILSIYAQVMSH